MSFHSIFNGDSFIEHQRNRRARVAAQRHHRESQGFGADNVALLFAAAVFFILVAILSPY